MTRPKVTNIWTLILEAALFICMPINLYLIFIHAPVEKSMGQVQRILYVHVPTDWASFLAFFVVFVSSIAYLRKRKPSFDYIAYAAAEVGVFFATLGLLTGSVWGRIAWNTWWQWTPRLTLFLVLWLIYVGYLMLRNFVDGEEKAARLAAVFGIVGFTDVPLVYMATRLWRDIHPGPVIGGPEGSGLEPEMRLALLFSLFTFSLLCIYLIAKRTALERQKVQLSDCRKQFAYEL